MMTRLPRSRAASLTMARVGIAGGFCASGLSEREDFGNAAKPVAHLHKEVGWWCRQDEEGPEQSPCAREHLEWEEREEERLCETANPAEVGWQVDELDFLILSELLRRRRTCKERDEREGCTASRKLTHRGTRGC